MSRAARTESGIIRRREWAALRPLPARAEPAATPTERSKPTLAPEVAAAPKPSARQEPPVAGEKLNGMDSLQLLVSRYQWRQSGAANVGLVHAELATDRSVGCAI